MVEQIFLKVTKALDNVNFFGQQIHFNMPKHLIHYFIISTFWCLFLGTFLSLSMNISIS